MATLRDTLRRKYPLGEDTPLIMYTQRSIKCTVINETHMLSCFSILERKSRKQNRAYLIIKIFESMQKRYSLERWSRDIYGRVLTLSNIALMNNNISFAKNNRHNTEGHVIACQNLSFS